MLKQFLKSALKNNYLFCIPAIISFAIGVFLAYIHDPALVLKVISPAGTYKGFLAFLSRIIIGIGYLWLAPAVFLEADKTLSKRVVVNPGSDTLMGLVVTGLGFAMIYKAFMALF